MPASWSRTPRPTVAAGWPPLLSLSQGFTVSWQHFATVPGVAAADQPLFFMGLYDGMMNETRPIGQRLPSPARRRTSATRAKRNAVAHAPGLELHPYTVAVGLGRQIRFAAPHAQLVETIERTLAGVLPAVTTK